MIHLPRITLFAGLLLLLSLPLSVKGEEVWLRNGQRLKGTIVNQSRNEIRLLTEGKVEVISKKNISRISYVPVSELDRQEKDAELERKSKEAQKREEIRLQNMTEEERLRTEKQNRDRQAALSSERDRLKAIREERERRATLALKERKHHSKLERERVRLQHTTGLMEFTGGDTLDVIVMKTKAGHMWVRSKVGNMEVEASDIRSMLIKTDDGEVRIGPEKIRGVMEFDLDSNELLLSGGTFIQGNHTGMTGGSFLYETEEGELPLRKEDIVGTKNPLPPPPEPGIHLTEGESGLIVLNGEQSMEGTILQISAHFIAIQTDFGRLEMQPDQVLYAGPFPEKMEAPSGESE